MVSKPLSMMWKRSGSVPAFARSSRSATVARVAPASWKRVMPLRLSSSKARSSALFCCSMSGSGTLISSMALSTNTPVASPFWSRMISPPSGDAVSLVIPESFIAAALTSNAWPSARSSTTGLFGTAAESAACVGKLRTETGGLRVHLLSCQPWPAIHCPGLRPFAAAATRCTICW